MGKCVPFFLTERVNTPPAQKCSVEAVFRASKVSGIVSVRENTKDESHSRIKAGGASTLAGSYRAFTVPRNGVKKEGEISLLRSLSPRAYSRKKKAGVMLRKQHHLRRKGIFRPAKRQNRRCFFADKYPQELRRLNKDRAPSVSESCPQYVNSLITLHRWDGY